MLDKNDPLLHWAMLTLTTEVTASGVKFTVTTNHLCRLHILWTTTPPQKHITKTKRRGADVGKVTRFCCVATHQVWQTEAGDTTTHTITVEPWPGCSTRWFRFHGTVNGQNSPSDTPCLNYHRVPPPYGPPVTVKFYSDSDPEVTTVDGFVNRQGYQTTWADLRNGAGTYHMDKWETLWAFFWASSAANKWTLLRRSIMLFNLASIPPGSLIISARLALWKVNAMDELGAAPTFCIVDSTPASNIDLVNADYQQLGLTPLSAAYSYTTLPIPGWHYIPLNAIGLTRIIPGTIVKLGLRDVKYDIGNVIPPWISAKRSYVEFNSGDNAYPPRSYLEVTYQPPG